jgi:hypothetical protein
LGRRSGGRERPVGNYSKIYVSDFFKKEVSRNASFPVRPKQMRLGLVELRIRRLFLVLFREIQEEYWFKLSLM